MHSRYQPCSPHTDEPWPWAVCSSFLASSYKIGMRILTLRASGDHSLWVVLTLLTSVPWLYGDIARYTDTLALARAKTKNTRVLAAVGLHVSGAP